MPHGLIFCIYSNENLKFRRSGFNNGNNMTWQVELCSLSVKEKDLNYFLKNNCSVVCWYMNIQWYIIDKKAFTPRTRTTFLKVLQCQMKMYCKFNSDLWGCVFNWTINDLTLTVPKAKSQDHFPKVHQKFTF